MKVYHGICKGAMHPVFCEDFLISQSHENYFLGAVFDGCSGGKDSHFASALMGKLLSKAFQKSINSSFLENQPSPHDLTKYLLKSLFEDMQQSQQQLQLERREMLATLILLTYEARQKQLFIQVIGDGVVAIDGEIHEIDQQNTPDYMAYHLDKSFAEYYASLGQYFACQQPQDVSIATDGISTFRSIKTDLPEGFDPVDFLLKNTMFTNLPNMVQRKLVILQKRYGFQPGDDVSMIRARFI